MDIHYVEIPTVELSTRMHCIYQNIYPFAVVKTFEFYAHFDYEVSSNKTALRVCTG